MMEIIKRQAAIVRGLKYFFTSKPCRRGHVAERKVIGGARRLCVVGTTKRWRGANTDHVRALGAKYRAAKRRNYRW